MALLELKTDLKSLKFDDGLNRKPLIVKDIDGEGGRNSMMAVQGILAGKRLDDTIRMAKLVIAKPGLSHAAKQAINGFINSADTRATYEGGIGLGKELIDKALDILTSAVSNVAQTPLNGLGLHLHKGNLELKGKSYRSYTDRVFGSDSPALVNLIKTGHTTNVSAGISKSKKIPLNESSDAKKMGRVNYLKADLDYNSIAPGGRGELSSMKVIKGEPGQNAFEDSMLDIIPFRFYVYDQGPGKEASIVAFRALLDSFNDNYSANWNKTQYIGRPESFVNYNGFDRNISLSFKIAAFSRVELVPLYRKLNLLVSTTAPTFSDDSLFMRGTFCRITVGDYLDKVPVTVPSIGLNWQQDYPWEIQLAPDKEKDIIKVPHVLDVQMTLDVHHDFVPQTGLVPFIGPRSTKFIKMTDDGKPMPISQQTDIYKDLK
mgnify:CR=1 FL=1|jgi:hypothetical protein